MNDPVSLAALGVAVIAALIALWQGKTSKDQLDLAKKQLAAAEQTEQRTERALEEIRRVTNETRQISQDVKNGIEQQVNKIIDSKISAEGHSQQMGAKFMEQIFKNMGEQQN